MTIEHTGIIAHGKPKPDKDPNALKIASFRTKEGVWAEFCCKAESIGLTATDVLKAAMEQFINGEYQPTVGASIHYHDAGLTRNDVLEIVNTLSIPTDESIHIIVSTYINTAVDRLNEVVTDTRSQLVEVKEELKKLEGRVSVTTDAIAKPSPTKSSMTWAEFCELVGVDIPAKTERNAASGNKMVELGVAKNIVGLKYKSNNSTFVKVIEVSDGN